MAARATRIMGEHDTWYTLLPFWHDFEHTFEEGLRREWRMLVFQETHFSMVHVVGALLAALLIIVATFRYRAGVRASAHDGMVPPRRLTLGAMVDGIVGAVYRMSVDILGEKDARRYLPVTGTLALFIFACNIQGLVPGLLPPTDSFKTNVALSLIVFVIYLASGMIRNPRHFFGEFLGPKVGGFPWLAPIFLPVELATHLARPVSLSLRLTGNILADHKVVVAIAGLIAIVVPVPFLMLGVLVAIIQTLLFTVLSIIYIGLAVQHAEGH